MGQNFEGMATGPGLSSFSISTKALSFCIERQGILQRNFVYLLDETEASGIIGHQVFFVIDTRFPWALPVERDEHCKTMRLAKLIQGIQF